MYGRIPPLLPDVSPMFGGWALGPPADYLSLYTLKISLRGKAVFMMLFVETA
jgi:hypothetical protein